MIRGTRGAILKKVTPFDLHGERYYDLVYVFADDPGEEVMAARVAYDAIYDGPRAGDRVTLQFLLNMVTKVDRAG